MGSSRTTPTAFSASFSCSRAQVSCHLADLSAQPRRLSRGLSQVSVCASASSMLTQLRQGPGSCVPAGTAHVAPEP